MKSKAIVLLVMAVLTISVSVQADESQPMAPLLTVTIPNVAVEPGANHVDVPVVLTTQPGVEIAVSSISLSVAYDLQLVCDQVTFPSVSEWDDISSAIKSGDQRTYVHFLGWNDLGGEDNQPLMVTEQPTVLAVMRFSFTDEHPLSAGLIFVEDSRAGTSFGDPTGSVDYRLKLEPGAIVFGPTGINDQENLPQDFNLAQNYPNPFNAHTAIRFAVPADCHVTLDVYNILGQEVASLFDENVAAGYYSVNWNATSLPSGAYFYKLTAGVYETTKRLMLLK
jgi:hypothetical protein